MSDETLQAVPAAKKRVPKTKIHVMRKNDGVTMEIRLLTPQVLREYASDDLRISIGGDTVDEFVESVTAYREKVDDRLSQ